MDTINFLITGVGGQGTVLASDIMAAVGLAAGYDVKKSDILGLAVRGGAVVGHVRWGEQVHSPIVPEGRVDYLVAFEILECLRWLNQVRPEGTILINQQEIHPVTFRRDWIVDGFIYDLSCGNGKLVSADTSVLFAYLTGYTKRTFLAEMLKLFKKIVVDLALFDDTLAQAAAVTNNEK